MIISHKHRFIFVKTKKTAGTTIEIALSKILGKDDVVSPISTEDERFRKEYANISAQNYVLPFSKYSKSDILKTALYGRRPKFYNHMSAREIKLHVDDEVWNNYFKFTLERNPFDKMVSLYYWRGGDERFGNLYDFLSKGGLANFNSYDLYTIDGVVSVDKVYKYEEMSEMLVDLSKRFELKEALELPPHRAKSNTRKVRDHKQLIDHKSRELIETIFAREIKLLDYRF